MTKLEKIQTLIYDLDNNKHLLKLIKFQDIVQYSKDNDLKWSITDIGRNQKEDLIKSIISYMK